MQDIFIAILAYLSRGGLVPTAQLTLAVEDRDAAMAASASAQAQLRVAQSQLAANQARVADLERQLAALQTPTQRLNG